MAPPARHGFPPSVFIIGAQKAGTTYLANLLAAQETVCVAQPKEPDYFTRHHGHGEAWYRAHFARPDKVLVDGSTSYTLYGPTNGPAGTDPAARIHAASPDARLIYVVRHPIRRAHSAYLHACRYGEERRTFDACLAPDAGYVMASRYPHQLDAYRRFFPPDQIHVVSAEHLWHTPEQVLAGVSDFLGLPRPAPLTGSVAETPVNRAVAFNGLGAGLTRLLGKRGLKTANSLVKTVLPGELHHALKRLVTRTPPEITHAHWARLATLLEADTQRLAKETGIIYDLSPPADLQPSKPNVETRRLD